MKVLRSLALLAALALPFALSAPAQAATGGFAGPVSGAQADTVAKALTLGDDAPVVLTGNIVSQVAGKKDKFIFKDATGEVRMEIDRKVFAGQSVTPADTVRIVGKVDKDLGKDVKIEAKSLEIVK